MLSLNDVVVVVVVAGKKDAESTYVGSRFKRRDQTRPREKRVEAGQSSELAIITTGGTGKKWACHVIRWSWL